MAIIYGTKVVFGMPTEIKPILPKPGRMVRLRFRPKECGRAFVVGCNEEIECIIEDCGDHWKLRHDLKIAKNARFT